MAEYDLFSDESKRIPVCLGAILLPYYVHINFKVEMSFALLGVIAL